MGDTSKMFFGWENNYNPWDLGYTCIDMYGTSVVKSRLKYCSTASLQELFTSIYSVSCLSISFLMRAVLTVRVGGEGFGLSVFWCGREGGAGVWRVKGCKGVRVEQDVAEDCPTRIRRTSKLVRPPVLCSNAHVCGFQHDVFFNQIKLSTIIHHI